MARPSAAISPGEVLRAAARLGLLPERVTDGPVDEAGLERLCHFLGYELRLRTAARARDRADDDVSATRAPDHGRDGPAAPLPPAAEPVATPATASRAARDHEVPRLAPARTTAPEPPAWLADAEPLPDVDATRSDAAPEHASVLPTRARSTWMRALLGRPEPSAELDIERLVSTLALMQPVLTLPYRTRHGATRGVQLLVDMGAGMQPFTADRDEFLALAGRLVPDGGIELSTFDGNPLAGVFTERDVDALTYRPPRPGAPVIIVSSLGLERVGRGTGRHASAPPWLRQLRRLLPASAHPVRVLVPYPRARWPRDIPRGVALTCWDEASIRPTAAALATGVRARTASGAPTTERVSSRDVRRRLDAFLARSPELAGLAAAVSLPVLLESRLLRRIRLRCFPGLTMDAEADLWFSGLFTTRGIDAARMAGPVQTALRRTLAGDRPLLDQVWTLVADAHPGRPPSYRLEEELTYQALIGAPESELGARLERALATLVERGQDRPELARWALRMLARLPQRASATPAAALLRLAATTRLHGLEPRLPTGPASPGVGPAQGWLVPASSPRRPVGVRVEGDTLHVGLALDAPHTHLEVPDIPGHRPALLAQTQGELIALLELEEHTSVALELDCGPITLINALGEEYDFEGHALEAPDEVPDEAPDEVPDEAPDEAWAAIDIGAPADEVDAGRARYVLRVHHESDALPRGEHALALVRVDQRGEEVLAHHDRGFSTAAFEGVPLHAISVRPPTGTSHRAWLRTAGLALYERLAPEPIDRALQDLPAECLALELRSPRLEGVPWELLRRPMHPNPLFVDPDAPWLRNITGPDEITRRVAHEWPLRVMVVVGSAPDDAHVRATDAVYVLEDLARGDEGQEHGWEERPGARWVRGDILLLQLFQPTLDEIEREAGRFKPHVFHFIGHGRIQEGEPELRVYARADASHHAWRHDSILASFAPNAVPRLVYLDIAQSSPEANAVSAQGQVFRDMGVASVLTVCEEMPGAPAIDFAREFYTALFAGASVAHAVARARRSMLARGKTEWYTPRLWVRGDPEDCIRVGQRPCGPIPEHWQPGSLLPGHSMFVGRWRERFEAWRYATEDPGEGLIIVRGARGTGRTWFVHLIMEMYALMGHSTFHVDLEGEVGDYPAVLQHILATCTARVPGASTGPPLDARAFQIFERLHRRGDERYAQVARLRSRLGSALWTGLLASSTHAPILLVLDQMDHFEERAVHDIGYGFLHRYRPRDASGAIRAILVLDHAQADSLARQPFRTPPPIIDINDFSTFERDFYMPLHFAWRARRSPASGWASAQAQDPAGVVTRLSDIIRNTDTRLPSGFGAATPLFAMMEQGKSRDPL